MPNSANKSNSSRNNSGKGAPKHQTSGDDTSSKANPERSDLKRGTGSGNDGNTSRTSNQGRKSASGGS